MRGPAAAIVLAACANGGWCSRSDYPALHRSRVVLQAAADEPLLPLTAVNQRPLRHGPKPSPRFPSRGAEASFADPAKRIQQTIRDASLPMRAELPPQHVERVVLGRPAAPG